MELPLCIRSTGIRRSRTVMCRRKPFQAFSILYMLEVVLHNMFPLRVILPVKAETNLLIKLDCMGIVFIYAKIHGVALVLQAEPVKKGKNSLPAIASSLIFFINQQPVQP